MPSPIPFVSQSFEIYGSLGFGSPQSDATILANVYASLQLDPEAASEVTAVGTFSRVELQGAEGFTGSGRGVGSIAQAINNMSGSSSGNLIGALGRLDNLAGTVTAGIGVQGILAQNAAGQTVTTFLGGDFQVGTNAGTLTTAYGARASVQGNDGTIGTFVGFGAGPVTGTVNLAIGVSVADLSAVTLAAGISSAVTAGSGKYNLFLDGTARNYIQGATHFGANVDTGLSLGSEDGLALKDGISEPATLAGYAKIYIDSGTGDLSVKYGDGTVKTIVVDT